MEIEDGCFGGFLSFAELERYFIHGKCKCWQQIISYKVS